MRMDSFCSECGEKSSHGAVYCSKCGKRLQPTQEYISKTEDLITPETVAAEEFVRLPEAEIETSKESDFRERFIIIALILILVLVVAKYSNSNSSDTEVNSTVKVENLLIAGDAKAKFDQKRFQGDSVCQMTGDFLDFISAGTNEVDRPLTTSEARTILKIIRNGQIDQGLNREIFDQYIKDASSASDVEHIRQFTDRMYSLECWRAWDDQREPAVSTATQKPKPSTSVESLIRNGLESNCTNLPSNFSALRFQSRGQTFNNYGEPLDLFSLGATNLSYLDGSSTSRVGYADANSYSTLQSWQCLIPFDISK